MLAAIGSCSLQDDVFQEDATTNDLEAHCAALTGKESGLFVLSGTMGNQLALRALLTQPPHAVLCDHRAHIVTSEAGGIALLTSAMVNPVVPRNGLYLTLADVRRISGPRAVLSRVPRALSASRIPSMASSRHSTRSAGSLRSRASAASRCTATAPGCGSCRRRRGQLA